MRIAYERAIDTLPVLQAIQEFINLNGVPVQIPPGQLQGLASAAQASEQSCRAALTDTRKAHENKTLAPGHPWFGKRLQWGAITWRAKVRDGLLILEGAQDFEVVSSV